MGLPGFRDVPDGFILDEYLVDQDNWTEGYVTITQGPLLRERRASDATVELVFGQGVDRLKKDGAIVEHGPALDSLSRAFHRSVEAIADSIIKDEDADDSEAQTLADGAHDGRCITPRGPGGGVKTLRMIPHPQPCSPRSAR